MPEGAYRLTRRAERDLFDIFRFGRERFGDRQAGRYADGLDRTFRLLADNPELGRKADRIRPGVRRHEHGAHVILYERDGEGVLVLALVHKRSVQGLAV